MGPQALSSTELLACLLQSADAFQQAQRLLVRFEDLGGLARATELELTAIEGPKTSWNSPLHAFEDAFAHEEYISGRINKLMTLAREVRDYATEELLHWFVKEQVEEEASVDEVVQKLKMLGDARNGLLMLDKELGKRD